MIVGVIIALVSGIRWYNNYYDLHVIIRGVNKQNLGVYKSFISLRPKAEVK